MHNRRKFRSQISDKMDRWKGRGRKRVREEKRREEKKKQDQRRERVRGKKMQAREKVEKSWNTVFFRCLWLRRVEKYTRQSGGCGATWPNERWKSAHRCGAKHISKSKHTKHTILGALLEVDMSKKRTPLWREHSSKSKCKKHITFRAVLEVEMFKKFTPLWREAHFEVKTYKTHHSRSTFGSWEKEKCTPLRREAHFQVNMYKTHQRRTTFGSWDDDKIHAVAAQNAQNTAWLDQFWKLRCRKMHGVVARRTYRTQRCYIKLTGSEHFWKFWKLRCWESAPLVARSTFRRQNRQKSTKHTTFKAVLEVEMFKKCTPLWREAHFEVKMYKTPQLRGSFLEGQMSKQCRLLWHEAHWFQSQRC